MNGKRRANCDWGERGGKKMRRFEEAQVASLTSVLGMTRIQVRAQR